MKRFSQRIAETPSAIIDELLLAHENVRFNLAPGSPCTVPNPTVMTHAISLLSDPAKVAALSRYDQVHGSSALRKRWANYLYNPNYSLEASLEISEQPLEKLLPEHDIMVTAGANQAFVNVMLTICDPGDDVLLPAPYYLAHKNALAMTNVHAIHVQPNLSTLLPSLQSISSAQTCRTRALVITNPNNPAGVVYPAQLLNGLSEFCARRGMYLILDEAYREYNFTALDRDSPQHPVFSPKLAPHIIKLHTMSKAFGLAGWRIGAVTYPRDLSEHMCKAQDTIPTHASNFSQAVAHFALAMPFTHVFEAVCIRHIFVSALVNLYRGTPLQEKFVIPDGAFYVFTPYSFEPTSCKTNDDDYVVHRLATDFGVLVIPGYSFGLSGYVRVCYGAVHVDDAPDAAAALVNGVQSIMKGGLTEIKMQ